MKIATTFLLWLATSHCAWAQVVSPQPSKSAPYPQPLTIEASDEKSTQGMAAAVLKRPHLVPASHTEKPVTIKPVSGTIATKECGAVTELTVLERSHEPAMVVLVLSAAKQGETLLLADANCLGNGKAVASSVSFAAKAQEQLPVDEQCKVAQPLGRKAGC